MNLAHVTVVKNISIVAEVINMLTERMRKIIDSFELSYQYL